MCWLIVMLWISGNCSWSYPSYSECQIQQNGEQGHCHLLQGGVVWDPWGAPYVPRGWSLLAGTIWVHQQLLPWVFFLKCFCFEIYLQYPVLLCGYSDYHWSRTKSPWPSCWHVFMPVNGCASGYSWLQQSWRGGKLEPLSVWQQVPGGQIYTGVKWLSLQWLHAHRRLCLGYMWNHGSMPCPQALSSACEAWTLAVRWQKSSSDSFCLFWLCWALPFNLPMSWLCSEAKEGSWFPSFPDMPSSSCWLEPAALEPVPFLCWIGLFIITQ